VLVTGAGGSIGSELCRQISLLNPTKLILVDDCEFNLYAIGLELTEAYPKLEIVQSLTNILNLKGIEALFIKYEIDVIYHAAAKKHVPLIEANPLAGIRTNVFGTISLAKIAIKHSVKKLVFISSDKAVRPTNVMGCTKRVAEMALLALETGNTIITMVRFGNVLGSSGSVVPRFQKQIDENRPITLTSEEITRYFMTIPEAAQLVIQAGSMSNGKDVFLLDMGEPVKIIDLARQMIALSGKDITIEITGLRPGEKLYEELLIDTNLAEKTNHTSIFKASENNSVKELSKSLTTLQELLDNQSSDEAVKLLKAIELAGRA
jgi:FlaA1/EpsC-like NDP-sugar epimerase